MVYPKLIVSNQKEESISIQRVKTQDTSNLAEKLLTGMFSITQTVIDSSLPVAVTYHKMLN